MREQSRLTEDVIHDVARKEYEEGMASFDWSADCAALLVIDMQNEFVEPGRTADWIPRATEISPEIAKLISICRQREVPVIYTVFSNTHHGLDRPYSGPMMPNRHTDSCLAERMEIASQFDRSALDEVWPDLMPLANELIIHKPSYGAFYDTALQTILRNLNRDTVIICGTLSNFCCGMTARQAYERGFKVVFGSDLTATDDPFLHEAELMTLRRGFAQVLSAVEIISRLDPSSGD